MWVPLPSLLLLFFGGVTVHALKFVESKKQLSSPILSADSLRVSGLRNETVLAGGAPDSASPSLVESPSLNAAITSYDFDVEKAIQSLVGYAAGKIPVIGTEISVLINIFWPSSSTDVWALIEERVKELVVQEIKDWYSDELKGKIAYIKSKLNDFDRSQKLFDINEAANKASEAFLTLKEHSRDYVVPLLPYLVSIMTLHLAALKVKWYKFDTQQSAWCWLDWFNLICEKGVGQKLKETVASYNEFLTTTLLNTIKDFEGDPKNFKLEHDDNGHKGGGWCRVTHRHSPPSVEIYRKHGKGPKQTCLKTRDGIAQRVKGDNDYANARLLSPLFNMTSAFAPAAPTKAWWDFEPIDQWKYLWVGPFAPYTVIENSDNGFHCPIWDGENTEMVQGVPVKIKSCRGNWLDYVSFGMRQGDGSIVWTNKATYPVTLQTGSDSQIVSVPPRQAVPPTGNNRTLSALPSALSNFLLSDRELGGEKRLSQSRDPSNSPESLLSSSESDTPNCVDVEIGSEGARAPEILSIKLTFATGGGSGTLRKLEATFADGKKEEIGGAQSYSDGVAEIVTPISGQGQGTGYYIRAFKVSSKGGIQAMLAWEKRKPS
uniref:Pesticidal crystal protein domain-containing protein n=1 Tax=Chromera velia CCMP2878 TaxID=1169474 RepID=A0A0G4HE52_9ALVE|eukprot:Cvel_6523.t1-p1 / transcript=Cvel_6523.t1 / gene=Cvel_6523 / organism=Chromera_velia_CCMP2878 / gene_product=hypothetical protein / transcript_product=hypothetical protein / location=Cvel_scaffold320:97733-99535(+) / protein_length=601 / sequence_SO=supercontig / SO=protein_coding / is_pseudo=false